MRRVSLLTLLLVAGVLALTIGATAQAQYVSYESITVANAAIGFTATTLNLSNGRQVSECTGRLETAQIRFTINGTTPTTTVGTLLEVGDTLTIKGHENLMKFRGIRTGSTSGVIQFQCGVS